MEKTIKPLAIKSSEFMLLMLVNGTIFSGCGCLCFALNFSLRIVLGVIFLIIGIFCLAMFMSMVFKPKLMLSFDEEGLYLNYHKNLYIKYEEINNINIREYKKFYGRETYNYGNIMLETEKGFYKVGVIKDLDRVYDIISKKIGK